MGLLDTRLVYKPFEYPTAFEYWDKAMKAHWLQSAL